MERPPDTIRVRIPGTDRVWELAPLETSPCTLACPTRINARGYVSLVADGRPVEALALIRARNPFPGVCGRICPRPCEAACTRGKYDEPIAVCALKRYVFDLESARGIDPSAPAARTRAEKIAVVGAGPAGLSAAAELAKLGYPVTIYEARREAGGMMNLIPGFRLPREVVRREAKGILRMGIELVTGVSFGADITWRSLRRAGCKALILATGAWHPVRRWGKVSAGGVVHAIELLEAAAEPPIGERGTQRERISGARVAVAGDGMMALDCARAAIRLGASSVSYIVGAGRERAPLRRDDLLLAEREGLRILFLARPKRFVARRGRLAEVVCARLEEGPADATGRREVFERRDAELRVEVDLFVDAHSRGVDIAGYAAALGLERTPAGTVAVDRGSSAAAPGGVFAAGDLVAGPRSVVEAIASGQRAAYGVHHYLSGESVASPLDLTIDDSIARAEYTLEAAPAKPAPRAAMPIESAKARRGDFREVERGFSDRAARVEAQRCLRCGPCSECTICADICEKKDFIIRIGDEYDVDAHAGREFWSALPETVLIDAAGEETEARALRTIVRVDEERCVGCGRCADVCGYKAVQVESRPGGRFAARVDELACKGCGVCLAVCPTGAIDQNNFEQEEIARRLASASARTKVLFVCRWARPSRLELPNDVLVVETMCAGRVAPSLLVDAALRGAPRILLCGCAEESCHYGFGRSRGRLAVERSRELLRVFGLNPNIVGELSTNPGEFALSIDRWAWKSK